jgi:hypothetical protein
MLSIEEVYAGIRKLAKNSDSQFLFSLNKDMPFLQLFENNNQLSMVQLTYLRYLNFYSSIMMDIALDEVTDIVLKNEVFEDAYMYWKQNGNKKIKDSSSQGAAPKVDPLKTSQWIFKSAVKK